MKKMQVITSIICAFIITICSIAQFHHHNNDGKMVIFSCKEQTTTCSHEHKHDNHQHKYAENSCTHGCHDSHQHDENNCSLKINIQKTENKNNSKVFIACVIIADYALNISNNLHSIYINPDIEFFSFEKISSIGLRAPPVL